MYLLTERSVTTKVTTALRQLVEKLQAATVTPAPGSRSQQAVSGVKMVDSLEEADLVVATRAKLKNSPKVGVCVRVWVYDCVCI